jgi:MFS family permease
VLELIRALLARRLSAIDRLLLGQLIMFCGIAALFPVVPLYVSAHGGGPVDIALFVAGPMIANTVVQVPAGRLADRIGRKPILIGARLTYVVFALLLFADVGPLWLLAAFRCAQGVSGGAYVPALRAAIADVTPVERRGRAYARLQACEMIGLLVGPLLGGTIALWRVSGIFLIAAVAVLAGTTALFRLPETRPVRAIGEAAPPPPSRTWWLHRGLLVPGAALASLGCMFSMYDVVWPQYLSTRGYDAFAIGMTISIYAVPIMLLAGTAGTLSDRADRRLLLGIGLGVVGACSALYPPLRTLLPIIGLGTIEACALVLIEPTAFAVLSESAPAEVRGRAMGLGGLFQFGGSGVGAAVLGSSYGLGEVVPFRAGAAICVGAAVLCILLVPHRRSGAASLDPPVSAALEIEART